MGYMNDPLSLSADLTVVDTEMHLEWVLALTKRCLFVLARLRNKPVTIVRWRNFYSLWPSVVEVCLPLNVAASGLSLVCLTGSWLGVWRATRKHAKNERDLKTGATVISGTIGTLCQVVALGDRMAVVMFPFMNV